MLLPNSTCKTTTLLKIKHLTSSELPKKSGISNPPIDSIVCKIFNFEAWH
jgi:hypothetical protein